MKYKKRKAFTLAEVMILLLTLSILLAAFAPVFTRRYNNASSDDVWAFVSSDDREDAYNDAVNKNFTAQSFIGLTPLDEDSVKNMSKDGSGNVLYSKLVIAAANAAKYGTSTKKQNQILFRYANNNAKDGDPVGALFADGSNFLLGGLYNNTVSGVHNTAYGSGSLRKLISGNANTAVGKNSLYNLTTGSYNTALGMNAGNALTEGSYNTAIGAYSLAKATTGDYNTAIGVNAMGEGEVTGSGNTAIGYNSLLKLTEGTGNTAVGYGSLKALTKGTYNTAVGYNSMIHLTTGSYNTAVGAFSCNSSDLTTNNYKTCIGVDSGNTGLAKLYKTDDERVFIGSAPLELVDGKTYDDSKVTDKPAAILEVHNINNSIPSTQAATKPNPSNLSSYSTLSTTSAPIPYMGASSVVINGNLIVRGNPYFETPIKRQSNMLASYYGNWDDDSEKRGDIWFEAHIPKGLVLYTLTNLEYDGGVQAMRAFDGFQRTERSWETCRGGCGRGSHQFNDVRPNCICTAVNKQSFDIGTNRGTSGNYNDNLGSYNYTIGKAKTHFDTTYDRYETSTIIKGSTSYDWASKTFALRDADPNRRSPYNGTAKIFPSRFGGSATSCNNYYLRDGDIPNQTNTGTGNDPSKSKDQPYINSGAYYYDRSFGKYIYLERRPILSRGGFHNDGNARSWEYALKGTDKPYAHIRLVDEVGDYNIRYSCCPVLTDVVESNANSPYEDLNKYENMGEFQRSDRRLKNVGAKFSAGLNEIRKLNVYNYTFKTDKNNIPQVGVIAQDLRMVFPNAVSKDENGYYQIRWDEMFYAAINSIKTLYAKAESLVTQVAKDKQRVTALKADNAELNAKLDNLESELNKLEAKKR